MNLRIALLPPDERPNTGGFAVTLGEALGAEILTPPDECMPHWHEPADTEALARWLREIAPTVDHAVVSLELLLHGGLTASRNTHDSTTEVLSRLEILRTLPVPISAYGVVQRLPHYDNPARSRQEPEYWATHGAALARLSRAWDELTFGERTLEEVEERRATVPEAHAKDLLRRRMRNHAANLAALELAVDGVLDFLVISSDDTAPRGLPAAERRALQTWVERMDADVLLYPGADEVPSVLVARVVTLASGRCPRVAVVCPDRDGLQRTAPYEDQAFGVGVQRQITAMGGTVVDPDDRPDLLLVVHPPAVSPGDWVMAPPTEPTPARECAAVVEAVRDGIARGLPVALVDVRWANGGDPTLVSALDDAGLLGALAAYGGWNTAGNSLGTTLAAGLAAVLRPGPNEARERFLARKVIEDAHYLPIVRAGLEEEARRRGLLDLPLEELDQTHARIQEELDAWAGSLRSLPGWRVPAARLPWTYTFTVDFDLERG